MFKKLNEQLLQNDIKYKEITLEEIELAEQQLIFGETLEAGQDLEAMYGANLWTNKKTGKLPTNDQANKNDEDRKKRIAKRTMDEKEEENTEDTKNMQQKLF